MKISLTTVPAICVFLADRLTKLRAIEHLVSKPVKVLPYFSLTYAENTGVSFGLFRGNNTFFILFTLALAGTLLFLRRKVEAYGKVAALGLALVLGGAIGNLYDRISYGYVVDFFNFSFFPAVFNVADSAITAGAVLMALGMRNEQKGTV